MKNYHRRPDQYSLVLFWTRFLGSGTTAEVARANGCRCIGIELSEEYIALAAKRLEQGTLFG